MDDLSFFKYSELSRRIDKLEQHQQYLVKELQAQNKIIVDLMNLEELQELKKNQNKIIVDLMNLKKILNAQTEKPNKEQKKQYEMEKNIYNLKQKILSTQQELKRIDNKINELSLTETDKILKAIKNQRWYFF